MYSTGYGARADRAILDILEDVRRRPRYTGVGGFVDASCAVDNHATGEGFWKKPDNDKRGFWNQKATSALEVRSSYGTTKDDVKDAARLLRGIVGRRFTFDEADAILTEAYVRTDCASGESLRALKEFLDVNQRSYFAARRARDRARWREAGLCIQCGGKHGEVAGGTQCKHCTDMQNERAKRRKQLKGEL
jgi:hypothetical protein